MSKSTKTQNAKSFWKKFVNEYWEKKPGVFKYTGLSCQDFNEQDIIRTFCEFRKNHGVSILNPRLLNLFVNGKAIRDLDLVDTMIPKEMDHSFIDYQERIKDSIGDNEFLIHLEEKALVYCPTLWQFSVDFHSDIMEHIGAPFDSGGSDIFVGRYRKTPFGVHRDQASSFVIPIVGQKKIRAWHRDYLQKYPELEWTRDYPNHLEHSQFLKASVGEFIYWPTPYYHIAESDNDFAVSIATGINMNTNAFSFLTRLFVDNLGKNVPEKIQNEFFTKAPARNRSSKGPVLPSQIIQLLKLLPATEEFIAYLEKRWACQMTSVGFRALEVQSDSIEIDGATPIRARSQIICRQSVDDKFYVSAGGKCVLLPIAKLFIPMFEKLNSRKAYTVKQLAKELDFGNDEFEVSEDDILALVKKMVQLNMLIVCT